MSSTPNTTPRELSFSTKPHDATSSKTNPAIKDGGFGDIKTHVQAFQFLPPKEDTEPQDNVWQKKSGVSLFHASGLSPKNTAGLSEEYAEGVSICVEPTINLFTDNTNATAEPNVRTRTLSGEDRELIEKLMDIGLPNQEAVSITYNLNDELNDYCQDDTGEIHKKGSEEDLNPPTKCTCSII